MFEIDWLLTIWTSIVFLMIAFAPVVLGIWLWRARSRCRTEDQEDQDVFASYART
ncbi:MAG: hypothetical protein WD960_09115 [Gemmatimonadota bacterium]